MMPMASSIEWLFDRSTSASAALNRLVMTAMSSLRCCGSLHRSGRNARLDHVDPHAAGRAFDRAHGGFDGVRIEVDHLGLRDLAHLRLRHLADLVLVRH